MGALINPSALSQSGERCLDRLVDIHFLGLPTPQVFVPIASSVEVHVSAMVARLVVLSSISDNPFGAALLQEAERDLTRTWNDRYRWLNRGFGLQLSGDSVPQRFNTLVEVRNSLVHGDGQLSDDQHGLTLKKLVALKKDMKKHLGVTADGRLRFGDDTKARAFAIAREYVQYFDQAVLKVYPAAKTL